jgi:nucleotide-binding universal stress UspA family protein
VKPRRVLVALDASGPSLRALDAAASIARRLDLELVGLFVEDISVVRLASLHFASEVGSLDGAPRRLDVGTVERSMRAVAERARRAVKERAEHHRVGWSFRVVRGSVGDQLGKAAGSAQLLALGRVSRADAPRGHLGSTAVAALATARRSVMLLPADGPRPGGPAVVLDDGAGDDEAAIRAALEIAPALAEEFVLVTISSDELAGKRRSSRFEKEMRRCGVRPARRHRLDSDLTAEGAAFLVVSAGGELTNTRRLQTLMARVDCPVVVARPTDSYPRVR